MADDDVFDVDAYEESKKPKAKAPEVGPLYRIYEGSKISVSRAYGPLWETRLGAAQKAYESVYTCWDEVFRYFNNHQSKTASTVKGTFMRGDATENVVYSNVNVMLPAIYGRDPDIAVNTMDKEDEPFAEAAKGVLNTLLRDRFKLNAKPKIKKAAGIALLTNFGVLKLDWVLKDDSREAANQELAEITKCIQTSKDQKELEDAYGKLEALEMNMEIFEPSGPTLKNVKSRNLVIDPLAEMSDGSDAEWMIEEIFFLTKALKYRYTKEDEDGRVYLFKPTHKVVFEEGQQGNRDDGLGMVMAALGKEDNPQEQEEVSGYRELYYTKCYLVWDKATRRVSLFAADDFKWPLWVWDDPHKTTRFFPYFILGFSMATGGTVAVGEVSYYLDQQDEINEINRQVQRIRAAVFNYFFYNSNKVKSTEIEGVVDAIRGRTPTNKATVGIDVPEGMSIKDMIETIVPPSLEYEALFNKEPTLATINRISSMSDAIRGVQFKTNTNEAAVQSYQDSARMTIGAKVESIEDMLADLCRALLESCVQHLTKEDVIDMIGAGLGEGWVQMDPKMMQRKINLEIVPGTIEKPNSVFKKKEAVQVAQAIGQFASAAPVSTLKVALRVLEKAFTEVVIKPEDWDMLEKEMMMQAQRGNSMGPGAPQPGAQGGGAAGAPDQANAPAGAGSIPPELANLPPEVKQQVEQMHQQGAPPEAIKQFLEQAVASQGQGQPSVQ